MTVASTSGTAAAVAPAPVAQPAPAPAKRGFRIGRFLGISVLLLVLGFFAWIFIQQNAGTKATTRMIATAVRAPIEVKNEVENLRAASWKAIALNLPYTGTVNIDLSVANGNPVDVFLTTPDQLEAMQKEQWSSVLAYTDFNATGTKLYRRSGRLTEGNYFLVVRDRSLGILSASASDISVKVQLNP
jgi:hypothetical protein